MPLSVYAGRGFDTSAITAHAKDDDKKPCQMFGTLYRVWISIAEDEKIKEGVRSELLSLAEKAACRKRARKEEGLDSGSEQEKPAAAGSSWAASLATSTAKDQKKAAAKAKAEQRKMVGKAKRDANAVLNRVQPTFLCLDNAMKSKLISSLPKAAVQQACWHVGRCVCCLQPFSIL